MQTRPEYVNHLRQVYGLGVKDSDNTVASYDQYFRNMKPGLSLGRLLGNVLERKPVARILDIGCGDAGMLKELLRTYRGKIEAHGIDLVPPKIGKQGLRMHVGDAVELPFPIDCDLIVSFRSMHEVGALECLLPKIATAVAAGGKAYLSIRISECSLEPGCHHPGLEVLRPEGRPAPPGIEFQGSMTQADLDWLRQAAAIGTIEKARMTCAEVTGQTPDKPPVTFVRGVNVLLER